MKDFVDLFEEILQEMPEAMQNLTLGELAYNSSEARYVADFLEASGVIILPCKPGDTIYEIAYAPCHHGETFPDGMGCDGCEDKCDIKKIVKERKVRDLQDILYCFYRNPGMKNTTYFTNKEEAEKYI